MWQQQGTVLGPYSALMQKASEADDPLKQPLRQIKRRKDLGPAPVAPLPTPVAPLDTSGSPPAVAPTFTISPSTQILPTPPPVPSPHHPHHHHPHHLPPHHHPHATTDKLAAQLSATTMFGKAPSPPASADERIKRPYSYITAGAAAAASSAAEIFSLHPPFFQNQHQPQPQHGQQQQRKATNNNKKKMKRKSNDNSKIPLWKYISDAAIGQRVDEMANYIMANPDALNRAEFTSLRTLIREASRDPNKYNLNDENNNVDSDRSPTPYFLSSPAKTAESDQSPHVSATTFEF